jgi:hypothetical protein
MPAYLIAYNNLDQDNKCQNIKSSAVISKFDGYERKVATELMRDCSVKDEMHVNYAGKCLY